MRRGRRGRRRENEILCFLIVCDVERKRETSWAMGNEEEKEEKDIS